MTVVDDAVSQNSDTWHLSSEKFDTRHFTEDGKKIIVKIYRFIGKDNVTVYYCSLKKRLFVLVQPSLEMLYMQADADDLEMLLNSSALAKQAAAGFPGKSFSKDNFSSLIS